MVFHLAPMSTGIRWITMALLLLPAVLVGAGAISGAGYVLFPVTAVVVLLYLGTWCLLRPRRFELAETELRLRFPCRTMSIPKMAIRSARLLSGSELRKELGLTVRVGAGGLWGAFGWLWSRKLGWLELYISRQDRFVWISRIDGVPLLLTPEDPERFKEALTQDL